MIEARVSGPIGATVTGGGLPPVQIIPNGIAVIALNSGPPGSQGPSGSADVSRFATVAGVNGHRVLASVAGAVAHVDATDVDSADQVLGVSMNAAVGGGAVTVRTYGVIDEAGWSWTPGLPVYVTGAGMLTQAIPSSPDRYILRVGFAETATRLFVNLGEPLYLET